MGEEVARRREPAELEKVVVEPAMDIVSFDAIARRRQVLQLEDSQRQANIRAERMLRQVPRKFRKKRLHDYEARNSSQAQAVGAVAEWVKRTLAGEPMMMALVGETGTGKSHLLYGAAWALHEANGPVPFCVRWYDFGKELREGRGPVNEWNRPATPPSAVRAEWWGADVCLIDEARETSEFTVDATALAAYAFHAYNEEIPVLLTTNIGTLAEVLGGPAADRFEQVILIGGGRHG